MFYKRRVTNLRFASAVRELTLSEQCDEDVILWRRWGNLFRYSEGSQYLRLQGLAVQEGVNPLKIETTRPPETS